MKISYVAPALALLALSACAPVAPRSESGPGQSGEAVASPPRTLSILLRTEPLGATDSSASLNRISLALFSAPLVASDGHEERFPILAEALPELNTDTWRVYPDGRMETTYRLRPGLTWHDGTPLTAEDFVFARRVDAARIEWGQGSATDEFRLLDEVAAPDSRTLLMRWKQPYTEAAIPALMPRARHILEFALDQGQPEAFGAHPYWTAEYIGAGPYRLTRWERGAFIEGVAFDNFALGRAKIERVQLTWNQDPNVTLGRLLSGDGHIAVDDAVQFQQATTLRQEWAPTNGGTLILNPTRLRYVQVQYRPEYVSPRALLDVRVRRALLYAIDRPTLAATMLEGQGMVAETIVPPTVSFYGDIDRAITKYPFDPRRTDQLMAEAGFPKADDGYYTSQAEGKFGLQVRGIAEGQEGQETTIIADYLRRAGADATLDLVPSAQRIQSDELKATFPAFTANNATIYRDLGLNKNLTSRVASPANRWSGSNKSGYSNAGYDRLFETWNTTLDRGERVNVIVQLLKLVNDDLPALPMYFNFDVVAHVAALEGPQPAAPDTTYYTNVYEWRWR
jgi:peptide/nickel transport system substrate-binding protein